MGFEGLGLLWVPYLCLLLFLLCLIAASFSHYHKKWAARYQARAELKQQMRDGTYKPPSRAGMLSGHILQQNKGPNCPQPIVWTPPLERKADIQIKPSHVHRTEVREAAAQLKNAQRNAKNEIVDSLAGCVPLAEHCYTNSKLADEDCCEDSDAGFSYEDAASSRYNTPRHSVELPHKPVVTSFWSTAASASAYRDRNRRTAAFNSRGFTSNI